MRKAIQQPVKVKTNRGQEILLSDKSVHVVEKYYLKKTKRKKKKEKRKEECMTC